MLTQLLPNMLGPIIVIGTLGMGGAVLAEAALSFLGLGIRPPFPSWGSMLSDARDQITTAPWISIFPGLAIFITVLGLNLLGDGLRDILDPAIDGAGEGVSADAAARRSRPADRPRARRTKRFAAVQDVSFSIGRGETFGLVGESGCGKSITALALIGLLRPPLRHRRRDRSASTAARSRALRPAEMRRLRGKRIAMIFQEPMTALNPLSPVGRQIAEMFVLHEGASWQEAERRAVEALASVRVAGARAARQGLSAPAVGRHAPARDDRHRAGLQPRSAARRRADDGARRDGAGRDPRPRSASSAPPRAPPS